jgi:tetratricopeptide (TPR) repeat protein
MANEKPFKRYYLVPIPIGLIISLFVWLISTIGGDSAGTHLNNGYSALQSGNYSQAIVEYDKVLELEPDSKGAYMNRAIAHLAVGNYDNAIADSNRALEFFPEKASVFYHRGIAYSAIDEDDKALDDFDEAIRLDPTYADAYFNRGIIRVENEYFDDAVADFSKAIEYTPEIFFGPESTPDLENEYRRVNISDFNFNQSPFGANLPMLYICRGFSYFKEANFEPAILDFNKAIQLDPYLSKAYFYRGITYLGQWEIERAINDFELVVELGNDPEIVKEAEEILNDLQ